MKHVDVVLHKIWLDGLKHQSVAHSYIDISSIEATRKTAISNIHLVEKLQSDSEDVFISDCQKLGIIPESALSFHYDGQEFWIRGSRITFDVNFFYESLKVFNYPYFEDFFRDMTEP